MKIVKFRRMIIGALRTVSKGIQKRLKETGMGCPLSFYRKFAS